MEVHVPQSWPNVGRPGREDRRASDQLVEDALVGTWKSWPPSKRHSTAAATTSRPVGSSRLKARRHSGDCAKRARADAPADERLCLPSERFADLDEIWEYIVHRGATTDIAQAIFGADSLGSLYSIYSVAAVLAAAKARPRLPLTEQLGPPSCQAVPRTRRQAVSSTAPRPRTPCCGCPWRAREPSSA